MLVQSLAQSGDFETALSLLEDVSCAAGGAQVFVRLATDPALQRRAMAAARERWGARLKKPDPGRPLGDEFYRLFSAHWDKLERAEAEAWLDEVLQAIENEPYRTESIRFGESVTFHSVRDMHLFEMLNVVRALKPPQKLEELLSAPSDVAAGPKVYPLGLESLMAERPPAPSADAWRFPGGIGYAGCRHPRDFAFHREAMAAMRGDSSAVSRLLTEARHL